MGRALGARIAAGVLLLAGTGSQGLGADKAGYSLLNPTPGRLMRDMATDRPDTTETPFTVDAGHVQIETTVFGYTRSRPDADGAVSDSYEFANTNIRIGLTNSAEINVVWQPYGLARTRAKNAPTLRQTGIGSVDIRGKLNLWGNDDFAAAGSALGLLPFVTLPTDDDNGISAADVEGGMIVPLALALAHGFGLGINGGAVLAPDENGAGHHAEYLGSASLAYAWTGKLGTYYEVAGQFGLDDARGDIVVLATGVTYAVTDNLQLDAGVNVGVTPAADRVNPFVGLSTRY